MGGQLLALYSTHISTAVLFIQVLIWLILDQKKLNGFYYGIAIGIIGNFISCTTLKIDGPSSVDSYLIEVIEEPRYRRVGEISFPVSILGKIKRNSSGAEYVSNTMPSRYLCKGVHLPWKNISQSKKGDQFFIKGKFKPINQKHSILSFDGYLKRQGLAGTCTIQYSSQYSSEIIKRDRGVFSKVREKIVRSTEKLLGQGEPSGIVLSMSIGTKDILTTKTEDAFKKAGLAHLLVVSGYQVTIIYAATLFLLTSLTGYLYRLAFFIPIKIVANIGALLVAYLFILLVGADGPVLRAGVALTIYALSKLLERGDGGGISFAVNLLLNSLFILTILSPAAYLDPGVELSYAALIGLMIGERLGQKPLSKYLYSSMIASFLASMVSLSWFGGFSFGSLLLNPIFAPLLSFIGCKGVIFGWALYYLRIDDEGLILRGISEILLWQRDFVRYVASAPLIYLESSVTLWSVIILFLLLGIFLIVKSPRVIGTAPCQ